MMDLTEEKEEEVDTYKPIMKAYGLFDEMDTTKPTKKTWQLTSTLKFAKRELREGPHYFASKLEAERAACKMFMEQLEAFIDNGNALAVLMEGGKEKLTDYPWLWEMANEHKWFVNGEGKSMYRDSIVAIECTIRDDEWQDEMWDGLTNLCVGTF
jgi:hypothetical protein